MMVAAVALSSSSLHCREVIRNNLVDGMGAVGFNRLKTSLASNGRRFFFRHSSRLAS